MIELNNISKVFSAGSSSIVAVNHLSLTINSGEYIAICGPSGGGKSTLLAILGLLEPPTSGEYYFKGKNTCALSDEERCLLRNREAGFIFQSFNLIERLTILENVMLPMLHWPDIRKKDLKNRAQAALASVDISHRKDYYPNQLSGGQQQRVALARAIVTKPSIIFADEPTGNLDSKNADIVMALIKSRHQSGGTVCMVTHNLQYTVQATRVLNIADGSILKKADPDDALTC